MPRLSKATRALVAMNDEWESMPYRPSARDQIKAELQRYINANLASADLDWTNASDVPTEREISWLDNGAVSLDDLHIPASKIKGAYASKDEYLGTQYKLMRTDGTLPLANAVHEVRSGNLKPDSKDYRVYDEVFITSVAVVRDGLAFKVEFSGTAIGKTVRWSKSKRLRSGSLVALTPANDNFNTKCVPAIIASRLLEDLEVKAPTKPSIFIYVGHPDQMDVDPQQKWIMVECTQGYWEAYRHTLKALQKVRTESFPLQEHIVNAETVVEAPIYRVEKPTMDISLAAHSDTTELKDLNVLQEWPAFQEVGAPLKDGTKITSDLNTSQIDALKRILTKKLAIVQGPPGTGKTFTSVAAIKILLDDMGKGDKTPPIIIAAQTNHAVDQILRHISRFEPEFVRLGGQTTDYDVIKPRTLYEIKGTKKKPPSAGTRSAANQRKTIGKELAELLLPIQRHEPISADMFFEHGLLSEKQRDSIKNIESKWIADTSTNKMNVWCDNRLVKRLNEDKVDAYFAQFEEEPEDLDEKEQESPDNDDDKFEHLIGRRFELCAGYRGTGRPTGIGDKDIATMLSNKQDLESIAEESRPEVYDYLRREITKKITKQVCHLGHKMKEAAIIAKIGRWETDFEFISSARVIGLTTTGLSKYRGLISLLKPKVVLIEEAAETLEPYTAAAIFDTLEHLILVGDHQQLRANCSYSGLIGEPVNFDVSLFERLVNNGVEFTRLNTQRRMRPEIRKLIQHIYPDLVDHSSVKDRPDIGGLGGSNVWFWHHTNEESTDEAFSKQNLTEARMIVETAKYLVWNNIPLNRITVLTYYNGQKKVLLENFARHEVFRGRRIKVCTVDSYQGEENDVILLSLVRNNAMHYMGFLDSVNRACVALSRARMGFYIFGNAQLLNSNPDWAKVIGQLREQQAVRSYLPLYCPNHDTELDARGYNNLEGLHGGCEQDCQGQLLCGHTCPLKCHPARGCDAEDCEEQCSKTLACGHQCGSGCGSPCDCPPCAEATRKNGPYYRVEVAQGSFTTEYVRIHDHSSKSSNDEATEMVTPNDMSGRRIRTSTYVFKNESLI